MQLYQEEATIQEIFRVLWGGGGGTGMDEEEEYEGNKPLRL